MTLLERAARWDEEGERIARNALSPIGVEPRLAEAAANCFAIAAALRVRAQTASTSHGGEG